MKYKYAYTKQGNKYLVFHQYDGVVIYETNSKTRAKNKVASLNNKEKKVKR